MRFACHGECPKNRFIETPDGEPGLNYLCAGYKAFFTHIDKPMRIMAELLRRNRAPAEVMLRAGSRGSASSESVRQSRTQRAVSLWQWSQIQAVSREINFAARHHIRPVGGIRHINLS